MNGNGLNILDMMLGTVQPTSGQPVGSGALTPDGLPFDLILSQFTDGLPTKKITDNSQTALANIELLTSDKLFDLLGANNVDAETLTTLNNVVEGSKSEVTSEEASIVTQPILPQTILSALKINQIQQPNTQVSDELSNLNLTSSSELKIIDWAVSDNNQSLNLTLQSEDNSIIRMSLPIESLDLDGVEQQRVSLGSMFDKNSEMKGLFDKLNLNELKIELADGTKNSSQPNTKTIDNAKIVAEANGQEKLIPLKLSVNGQAVSAEAVKVDARARNANIKSQPSKVMNPILATELSPVQRLLRPVSRPVAVADSSGLLEAKHKDVETIAKGFSFDTLKTHADVSNLNYSDKTELHTKENIQTVQRPVQFELPDNTKSLLKPNGHSVQLRINPEDLGPARLSLTLVNNQLKAVVIVENRMAKTALEGSIDRLVDTLAKADISVDSIEVNIDGESAKEQLFDQSPRFGRQIQSLAGKLHEQLSTDETIQESQIPQRAENYVSAHGVNLVA